LLTPTREAALAVQSPKLPPSTVTLDAPVTGPLTLVVLLTTGALKLSKRVTVLTTTELVEAKPRIKGTPAAALLESALSEIHPVVDWDPVPAKDTAGLTEEWLNDEPRTVTLTLPVEALLVPDALLVRITSELKASAAVPSILKNVADTTGTSVAPELALQTTELSVAQRETSSVLPPTREVPLRSTTPRSAARTVTLVAPVTAPLEATTSYGIGLPE
jgi:hypothetical protein